MTPVRPRSPVLLLATLVACGGVAPAGAPDGPEPDGPAADAAPTSVGPVVDPGVYQPWTLVVLPDTQAYASAYPSLFAVQTDWIAAHVAELDIRYVLHVGDVTEWNIASEWLVAQRAFATLDGTVPYALVTGNHDYDLARPRASQLTDYFPVASAAAMSGFGGTFEPDRLDSSFHTFDVRGEHWLILALEWGPRPAVLAWAAQVLDAHPDHRAIILTHAYLYGDDTRFDWAARGGAQDFNPHFYPPTAWPEVSDGEEIWQALINPRDQVHLVFSGHCVADGVGQLTSTTARGAQVHQLLANYQDRGTGGAAFLRIVTFHEHTIEVRTYSPWLDVYDDAFDQQFVLPRTGW